MFNPQARWDRKLPTSSKGEAEKIGPVRNTNFSNKGNEISNRVDVVARFRGGNFEPLYFSIGPYRHKISQINYRWMERKGKDLLHYFSVSDEVDNYCLSLSTETMSWRLTRLE